MHQFNIINFHNLKINNAEVSTKPFEESKFNAQDTYMVIFIEDPTTYFNSLFQQYLTNTMSPKLAKEVKSMLSTKDNAAFITWFKDLNYLPLINPQTFQLDMRKRIDIAIDNLNHFDYVVPYEYIDIFLEKISSDIIIEKPKKTPLSFSLSKISEHALIDHFIGKDQQLYDKANELWSTIQSNDFKSLKTLNIQKKEKEKKTINYIGIVDTINSNTIMGWVFRENDDAVLHVEIYQNGVLRRTVEANIFRPKVKKNRGHPTGNCGFKAKFKKDIFLSNDKIEVKILPDKILIPLGKNTQNFFTT